MTARAGVRGNAAVVMLLVALTGCGSTVVGVSGGAQSLTGGKAAAPAAGASAGAGLSLPDQVNASTGAAAPDNPSSSNGGGTVPSDTSSVGAATPGAAGSAPGVTPKTIYIGVEYCSQCGAGDRALGAAGAAPSYDYRNVFNAIADYANSHGGFAGRRLVPIYYNYDTTTPTSVQDQAACAHWTQDNKVFAIFGAPASDDVLRSCAQHEGGIALSEGGAETGQTMAHFPNYVDPTGIRLDRLAAVTVDGLVNAGYFAGWNMTAHTGASGPAKLGLVTWDDPDYRYSIAHGYLPALALHHLSAAETAYIAVPQQINDVSQMSAAVSNAVAKFKSDGIDHVIVQDGPAGVFGGTGLTLEWMYQARSQLYYPRYGQNTDNSPGWDGLPSDEMDHALAIDQADVDASRDAGWHSNQARDSCYAIESAAGYPVTSSNENDEVYAGMSCDVVFFLQRIISRLRTVTTEAFLAGVSQLGITFASAEVYGTKLGPGLRDGGDEVRIEEYLASCQCLQYRGRPYWAD